MAKPTKARQSKKPASAKPAPADVIDAQAEAIESQPATVEETPVLESDPIIPETDLADKADAPSDAAQATPQEAAVQTPVPENVTVRRGGLIPLVLGGALAAGIGIVSAPYIFPDGSPFGRQSAEQTSAFEAQQARIADLEARIAELPAVDANAIEATSAAVGDLQAQISSVSDAVNVIETRLTALEERPAGQGGVSAGAIAGYEAQMAEMRALLDAQKGEIAGMIEQAQGAEASAEETARQTMARAAVTRILVALDSGSSFEDALSDLNANSDIVVPEVLAQTASGGVPTLGALAEQYPDAARAALAAARSEEQGGGLGSFFAKQLGARSVAPREGNDPDAILSRMEAAVIDGRVSDALADMDALPDTAKAQLSEWAAQANLRLTAAREVEALANSLNSQ